MSIFEYNSYIYSTVFNDYFSTASIKWNEHKKTYHKILVIK